MRGFLDIDKPEGMTSFDVVRAVRRAARVKRVGHAGTLDPAATGVLPVAVGDATRLIDALMEVQKVSKVDDERIRSRLRDVSPNQSLMRETGRLLSELTGSAAVVVAPRPDTLTLKHLRFIRTLPGEVLAVLKQRQFFDCFVDPRYATKTQTATEVMRGASIDQLLRRTFKGAELEKAQRYLAVPESDGFWIEIRERILGS